MEEFIAARDALAKSLRSEGRREAADEVKRLRKPNLVAWALNQARHQRPEIVTELLAAGRRLQDAQHQLVTGGERGLLRTAAAAERRLVEEVVSFAERRLADAGHNAGALQGKLWSTAHAAAAGTEAAELLREGRLVRDYEVSDLGLSAAGAPTGPAAASNRLSRGNRPRQGNRPRSKEPATASKPAAAKQPAGRTRAQVNAERHERALIGRLERARIRLGELQQRADEAEREAAVARHEAARAASILDRAQAGAERARAGATDAAAEVAELERSLLSLAHRQ